MKTLYVTKSKIQYLTLISLNNGWYYNQVVYLFCQDRKSFSSDQSTVLILLIIIVHNILLGRKVGSILVNPSRMTATDTIISQDFQILEDLFY